MASAKKHIPLEGVLKGIKGKVHVHRTPRCKAGKHDKDCPSTPEIQCIEVPVPGHDNNVCVCIHLSV